jgi:prepilin-type N-terminal cleavage/methylation domain-containing protein
VTNPSRSRGYTVVELLMALAVFSVGISGIIALQKVTVVSNQHAKNLAIATRIADAWIGQLVADAATWNAPSPVEPKSDLNQSVWLSQVVGNGGIWIQPTYSGTRLFGPGFDALGNPVDPQAEPLQVQFCTHLRLGWLYPEAQGTGVIRAEIRVFWLREGEPSADGQAFCSPSSDPEQIGQSVTSYHFVYQTTAISQQPLS